MTAAEQHHEDQWTGQQPVPPTTSLALALIALDAAIADVSSSLVNYGHPWDDDDGQIAHAARDLAALQDRASAISDAQQPVRTLLGQLVKRIGTDDKKRRLTYYEGGGFFVERTWGSPGGSRVQWRHAEVMDSLWESGWFSATATGEVLDATPETVQAVLDRYLEVRSTGGWKATGLTAAGLNPDNYSERGAPTVGDVRVRLGSATTDEAVA